MNRKIVTISDTHSKHGRVDLPHGDLLICSGDITNYGYKFEVESFISWLIRNSYKFTYGIVFIAGNHDRSFDPKFVNEYLKTKEDFDNHIDGEKPYWLKQIISELPENIHYLENNGIELAGLKIWGSPITPWFGGDRWAFNKYRGDEINSIWKLIPSDTDIIITHGPSHLNLDYTLIGREYVGCEQLAYRIKEIKPKLHVFGHIHEDYGIVEKGDTIYVNTSICTLNYVPSNPPIVLDLN